MGVWGHKLFEDDCALDIRGDFRDHIGDGLSARAATTKMVAEWCPDLDDPEDYAVFWLALAAVQWDLGRLIPLVKKRALNVLDREIGLDAWEDASPKLLPKRRGVYRTLHKMLLRKQPPQKHVPRRVRMTAPWKPGTLFSYRCLSGRTIYCRVVDLSKDNSGVHMTVDICRWRKKSAPTLKEAIKLPRELPLANSEDPSMGWLAKLPAHGCFYLYGQGPKCPPMDRVQVLATKLKFPKMPRHSAGGTVFGGWKKLDEYLRTDFGIS